MFFHNTKLAQSICCSSSAASDQTQTLCVRDIPSYPFEPPNALTLLCCVYSSIVDKFDTGALRRSRIMTYVMDLIEEDSVMD